MDQEIEVGEVKEDGLRLWCARLALEYAKEEAKRQDDAIQRLKNRANSLVGWAVTIIIALSAVFFTHPVFRFSILITLIGLLTTALLSVITLYPTSWVYTHIPFDRMQVIQNELETELNITESLTKEYEKDINNNALIYYELQKAMKWAWILFLSSPFVGFAIQMSITYLAR